MRGPARSDFSRRFLIASLVFGLVVLFNLALFGWLIFRSLSQREVERVLTETKAEAETLAREIAHQAEGQQGRDLYTAVAVQHETQTYIDSVLRRREIIQTVEIRDRQGVLVYQGRARASLPVKPERMPEAPPPRSPELGQLHSPEVQALRSPELPHVETRTSNRSLTSQVPDIRVPIGDVGSLEIGISPTVLARRVERLRGELIRQAAVTGIFSMAALVSAYVLVWLLLRRARRLELQAAEAERLAYIGTLASGLAHEIRNPLNSLNLNMQMLEEEIDEQGRAAPMSKRLLSITRSEIDRLERLATDFLAYAKPRPLELAEVPAVQPLEHLRELLAGEVQKRGMRVVVEDRTGGALVRVDKAQIDQLLLNLARNSLAATEESGRPPYLKLTAWRQGPTVTLELLDNGVGIPPEERSKIFDLFYSTRKGGTGLGLAIVERIAHAHGGSIAVESSPGAGTAVSLELPLAGLPEATPRGALKPSATV
ncbi:MAG: ATP-binding protein [Acidobacteriota bacterium]|nr:ATP-binding protein [Acidobacteriota bacterium]